jgi:hypothetical protein
MLLLERNDMPDVEINLINPVVGNTLDMTVYSNEKLPYVYTISTVAGQLSSRGIIHCTNGPVHFQKDLSTLPAGKYFITLVSGDKKLTRSFLKTN